jgi:hypothetical protein
MTRSGVSLRSVPSIKSTTWPCRTICPQPVGHCTYRSRARAHPARQYNTIQQAILCTE